MTSTEERSPESVGCSSSGLEAEFNNGEGDLSFEKDRGHAQFWNSCGLEWGQCLGFLHSSLSKNRQFGGSTADPRSGRGSARSPGERGQGLLLGVSYSRCSEFRRPGKTLSGIRAQKQGSQICGLWEEVEVGIWLLCGPAAEGQSLRSSSGRCRRACFWEEGEAGQ